MGYIQKKNKNTKALEFVKYYLFHDYNRKNQNFYNAYRIILNGKLREGFEKNLDPEMIKKEAREEWEKKVKKKRKNILIKKKKWMIGLLG